MSIHGVEVITANGALITSGKPVRVYNVSIVGSGTAGVELYNGTAVSGTARVSFKAGAATRTTTQNFEGGLLFPGGCYVEIESGTSQAVIECRLEQ